LNIVVMTDEAFVGLPVLDRRGFVRACVVSQPMSLLDPFQLPIPNDAVCEGGLLSSW